tara:strand:+ start:249 stop:569 length:321 start_codon:yes stop_codon:yes gene_type:complete
VSQSSPTKAVKGKKVIPEKTKKQKLKVLAKNENTLKSYLVNYNCSFSKDIDELWVVHDRDKNGYLDKTEAKTFVSEISQCIERERANNYDATKFDTLFDRFDENKD